MLRPFCFVLLVCSQINLWSQNTGTLTGQVQVDGVEFQDRVNIILEQDGEFVMAGSARIGRPYFIEHLPEGNYDVSFVPKGLGMRASQDNVPIEAGKMTNIDVLISADGMQVTEPAVWDDERGKPRIEIVEVPQTPEKVIQWESYDFFPENGFVKVAEQPASSFSAEADQAFYTILRRSLRLGYLPPAPAVRIQEMLNFFPYPTQEVDAGKNFQTSFELTQNPWNAETQLLKVQVDSREWISAEMPPSHLTLLIDVSGSMTGGDRLDLVKKSIYLLVSKLRDEDRISIITYRDEAEHYMSVQNLSNREYVRRMVSQLQAEGSTQGSAGLQLAHDVAVEQYRKGENNRILVFTDGDFNVGIQSDSAIVELIEDLRSRKIYLSVLGYGSGNYKDSKLELLARHGNGHYVYVDHLKAAEKILVDELGASLFSIANDVKLQLNFEGGEAYRLIGYESRLLTPKEFRKKKTDAGEIGAGHQVIALYEVIPDQSGKLPLSLEIRYREPDNGVSRKERFNFSGELGPSPSAEMDFASSVAGFGLLLRESPHRASLSLDLVKQLYLSSRTKNPGFDPGRYRDGYETLLMRYEEVLSFTSH